MPTFLTAYDAHPGCGLTVDVSNDDACVPCLTFSATNVLHWGASLNGASNFRGEFTSAGGGPT